MTPYLIAHQLYTSIDREVEWTTALDIHHQTGAVISLPDVFFMARPVEWLASDDDHLDLSHHAPHSTAWHVWALAGNLSHALRIAIDHGVTHLSFQRHGLPQLRRLRLNGHLFNRAYSLHAGYCWREISKNQRS